MFQSSFIKTMFINTIMFSIDIFHYVQDFISSYIKPLYSNLMDTFEDHIELKEEYVDMCYLIYDKHTVKTHTVFHYSKNELLDLLKENLVIFSFLLNKHDKPNQSNRRRYIILSNYNIQLYFDDITHDGRLYLNPKIDIMRNYVQSPFLFAELNKHIDIYNNIKKYCVYKNYLTPLWFEYFIKYHDYTPQKINSYEIHYVNNKCVSGYWTNKQYCKIKQDGEISICEYDNEEQN